MLKKILPIVVLSACFLINTSRSQPSSYVAPPPVIPPSPDAASLGKYGGTPVGLHTGIPNISIPLYTIKTSRLEVPISISYHAGGVKVSEIASWIGLGWSLQAGGVITRSVVGKPDNLGFWVYPTKSASEIVTGDFDYVRSIADGSADGESDYYFYNFNGRSGKFIYYQNNNQDPLLIPQEPIVISFESSYFKVIDEKGVIYEFAAIEETETGSPSMAYPSSYYLSEIASADGTDHVYFTYDIDTAFLEGNVTYTETVGEKCVGNGTNPPSLVSNDHSKNQLTHSRLIYALRLTEINYSNGKVEFVRDYTRSDAPESRLAELKIYNKNSDGTFTSRKTISFGEDYFVANSGSLTNKYRLKLTGMEEKDQLTNTVKKYNFFYDESVNLPHRTSCAQDWWGFYNGKVLNKSLIASETVNFLNTPYQVGNANRNPDSTYMRAGVLKTIVYPTGGYTEFEYGSHLYAGTTKTQHNTSASAGQMGNTTDLLQQTVTFTPTDAGWARVYTYCSDVTDGDPYFSRVSVKKQNGPTLLEHIYQPYTYNPFEPHLEKDFWVYLLAGTTYELTVKSKGNSNSPQFNGAAFSQATVYWEQSTQGTTKVAGGLRVKGIRDYDGPGTSPVTRTYKYGPGESGIGTLLIPEYGLNSFKQEIDIEHYYIPCVGSGCTCQLGCLGKRLDISGRPALELSSLNGAPVVYDEVTVYENNAGAPNGKQVFVFGVEEDTFIGTDQAYNNGELQLNESWRGGDQVWTGIFKGTSTKVKEESHSPAVLNGVSANSTKIGWKVSLEGCTPTNLTSLTFDVFYFFDYPIHSGIKKLVSSSDTQYSSTDPSKFIFTQIEYGYLNLGPQHQQLTNQKTINYSGDTLETRYWYTADYNNVEDIATLKQKNIIGIPIKTETYRNQKIISGQVSRLNDNGNPVEVFSYESDTPDTPPVHSPNTIVPSGYNKKTDIAYDGTSKNINRVQKVNDVNTSYLWGYNNTYPVAKVENATVTNVAYSSFESAEKGNWNYGTATYGDIPVKTGTRYYKMNGGNISKSLTPGKYKLEYWAKGTAITLSGGTITTIRTSAPDANGWIFYEKEVNVTSTVTFQMSGSVTALIDELRIYPVNARMTTYTYDPVNGLTSITDPNNFTIYYSYDDFGRLKYIKDKDGNIAKAQEYHYKAN